MHRTAAIRRRAVPAAIIAAAAFLAVLSLPIHDVRAQVPCGAQGYLQEAQKCGEGQWQCQPQAQGCGPDSALEASGWAYQGEGAESGCAAEQDCCWKDSGAESTCKKDEGFKPIDLDNPLRTKSIPVLVGRAIQILTGVSGSIALLMFVWGGVIWLTSGGSPDKVQRGKKIFTWAAIGLVIIFGSYALVNAVLKAIGA